MLSLIQQGKGIAPIHQFLFSTAWLHSVAGHDNPTTSSMVATVLEGAKHTIKAPNLRKEPINPDIIQSMYIFLKRDDGSLDLAGRRIMAYVLLSFSAFLRCEEALKLRRSDIALHTTYMSVFIQSGKTDKYGEGKNIMVARTRLLSIQWCTYTNIL